jgi:uncharacterized membrane protein
MIAYGLSYIMRSELYFNQNILKFHVAIPVLTTLVIIMSTFFSAITSSNAADVNYVQKRADIASLYFSNSELAAFSFVKQNCNVDSILYGDYATVRNFYYFRDFHERRVIMGSDISYIRKGYLLFRFGELKKSGGLDFSPDGSTDYGYRYHILESNSTSQVDIIDSLSVKDRIYSDGDVQLFIINNGVFTN